MGLAMRGLTHCEKCGKALNYDEYVLCRSCEKEKEGGQAMTPEQAVKLLDNLSEYGLCYNITEEYQEAMKLVLSMLENQQERIDYLMRSIERKEQSLIEEHEENIECYTMLEKKEKIIDLMSEKIYQEGIVWDNKEEVKQYFENKAKEE